MRASIPTGDTPEQLTLFAARLPHRPYCTDELGSLQIRGQRQALRRRYLQVNPPTLRFWSVFDIDRPGAVLAWDDAGLPAPSWAAMNPDNGHAHVAWGLSAPVLTSDAARREPLRYLVAIESAYRAALEADPAYGGLVTKNPAHRHWRVLWGDTMARELGELADWVDLPRHLPARDVRPENVGLGRNCNVFELLRHWAYREVRAWKLARSHGAFIYWQQECYSRALRYNGDLPCPMDPSECWHIAKSVSRWVWTRFDITASDQRFSRLQAARGRKKGESKRQAGLRLLAAGATVSEVQQALEVAPRTVKYWRAQIRQSEGVQKP
ncbi:replication initiation protein [Arhodomonas sp. SL1]|uniref:replication initiation protein n=1 Tax=Arhodomonas sp. SL1 TaxID=3425691 RepID=UPI003F8828DE